MKWANRMKIRVKNKVSCGKNSSDSYSFTADEGRGSFDHKNLPFLKSKKWEAIQVLLASFSLSLLCYHPVWAGSVWSA